MSAAHDNSCGTTVGQAASLPIPGETVPEVDNIGDESTTEARPGLLAFFERFLDEQSIKWMLGLGMLTLLACSLKFVTEHWESYSPFWKYLVLIAYTAVMYAGAEISLHRLALRRTGTGLLALTLALLPLTFLALRWVAPGLPTDVFALMHHAGLAVLLGINIGFTAVASQRILRTLLREVPHTYWLSYLTLCVAGALVPAVPTALAPLAAVLLWIVFTAGVVKINRHVFWLAEEERWPRIFSFFPTVLLAAQFLTVFVLNLATSIATPWLGFGLVLVAVPVLLTADAVAAVFQRRTGQIVFPWPAEIVLPLVLGLGCCVAGLGLALTDLPRPVAFVPTAALAALCLGVVARRTGHSAFAWVMLLCLLGAYQFSPVYFQDLARQVRDQSAVAVHEARLPYAFYGITYAPFILGLLVASRWLKSPVFAAPCRQLSMVLCSVMLVASWTHPKAVFIAGATLTALWTLLRFGYRDRWLTWGAGVSWLSASVGLGTFVQEVCLIPVSADFTWWAVTVAAGVLWLIDRATSIARLQTETVGALEFLSVAAGCVIAAGWWSQFGLVFSTAGTSVAVAIVVLLAVHQRQRSYPVLGELILLLAGWAALRYGIAISIAGDTLLLAAVVVTATTWAFARAMESFAWSLTVSAFRLPALRVTTVSLALMQLLVLLALIFFAHGQRDALMVLLAAGTVTLWGIVAAGRSLPVAWVHVACVSLLVVAWRLLCYVATEAIANEWLPLLWAAVVVAGAEVARRLTRTSRDDVACAVGKAVDQFAFATLLLLTLGTLPWLTGPARFAGGLSILALAVRVRHHPGSLLRHVLVEAGFLQLLAGLLGLVTPAAFVWNVSPHTWQVVQLPGTLLVAVWMLVLQTPFIRRFVPDRDLLSVQAANWRTAVIFSLFATPFLQHAPLYPLHIATLVGAFALLAADQFRRAAHRQEVESVVYGLISLGVSVAYLAWFNVIDPYHVVPLGIGIATGIAFSAIGPACRRRVSTVIFAEPFERVGYWLPAAIATVAVFGSLREISVVWVGANSLIVLAAAACYFVQWIERRDAMSLVISTAIFNVSQMLLWNELRWTDPQLYLMPLGLSLIGLVEGLPRELHPEWKTTIRYAGALVILVSPLFHILDGAWLPLLTLMAASLVVSLLAIGLKSRPLLYSGAAFLAADLVALVVRGGLEHTDVLWIAGIGLGTAVVALAAYCENHRETVLQRMRLLAATLQTWE